MDTPNPSFGRHDGPDSSRRGVLIGLTATYLFSYVPSAMAQPADAVPREAFIAVSRILTGRPNLDPDQAVRLYEALVADAPGFPDDIQALRSFIDERKIDPARLQQALDVEQSALATVPRSIVKAWYTGIVGEAGRARCVTFETSLMFVAVADRLNPPSYCYGSYGSWTDKPA